ncbi:Beta-galactosidase (Beta-gal) (Lactase), partial [Durusdinium trenchii]
MFDLLSRQGYWPESLLTPPDASAVERDLRAIKACGFNTVRVHAVVMSTTFYSLCDELGLMVWQDMPAGDMRAMPLWWDGRAIAEEWADPAWSLDEIVRSEPSQSAFWQELQAMIKYLKPYPSIVSWVLFNEGWGQAETQATVDWVRQLDSTRLVDAVSGWNEVGSALGDFADIHNYEDNSSAFGALPESFVNYAAPAGNHPYISHAYVRSSTNYYSSQFPGHLAFLFFAWHKRPRRSRVKAEEQEAQAEEEGHEGQGGEAQSPKDVQGTWFDNARRACGMQRYDLLARIALSLSDLDTQLKMVLRTFRQRDLPPELGVQLLRCLEPWLRARVRGIKTWNEILYVWILADRLQEAWKLFRLMEDDEHLPSPNVATYTILLPAVAKHEGPQEALRILSRHRALGIALEPISCLMMGVIFAALPSPNLGMARLYVRKGERLLRDLRGTVRIHFAEQEPQYDLTFLYATMMAGYRRIGRTKDCFTLLGVMRQHGIRPN